MIVLSYHVDYWDRLGWTDPFGSRDWTKRQEDYTRAFKSRLKYTPMTVVMGDGHQSAPRATERKIRTHQQAKATLKLSVDATLNDKKISITASVKALKNADLPEGAKVIAAVAEDGLTTNVKRGENKGRELKENGVVRAIFEGKPLDGELKWTVEKEPDWKADNLRIVVFVQDPETLKVYEVAEKDLVEF